MDESNVLIDLIKNFNPLNFDKNKIEIEKKFKKILNRNDLNKLLLNCLNNSTVENKIIIFTFLKHFYGPNNSYTLNEQEILESFNFWLNYYLNNEYLLIIDNYINERGFINIFIDTFKIMFYKLNIDFFINFLNNLLYLKDKTILSELKILNLLKIILNLKHTSNNNDIKKLILNYLEINLVNIKNLIENYNNYIIISKIIKIIYKILGIYINDKNDTDWIKFIYENKKIREFNLFCYFFNYKINEDNFFLLNNNPFITIKILKSKIQIFDLFNKFLRLFKKYNKFKELELNDFFPVKNFIVKLVDDLEYFYSNNEIGKKFKKFHDFLNVISLYLEHIYNFMNNNFFNGLQNTNFFLKFIKLKNAFLNLNIEQKYKFNENPEDFYNDIKEMILYKKTNNIQSNYLKLIEISIEKIDIFLINIIDQLILDFKTNNEELIQIDMIFLINIVSYLKNRDNIINKIKPIIIELINFYILANNDFIKFYIIYFFKNSFEIFFDKEEDGNLTKNIIIYMMKILETKIKNNVDDSLLFLIIKTFNKLLVNNKIKQIISYNLDDFINLIYDLILINNNIKIIDLLFEIFKIFLYYFNKIENINKLEFFFSTSINKFIKSNKIKTRKLLELYIELLNFKDLKNNINIYNFLDLFKNILNEKNIEYNYSDIIIKIIKEFGIINDNILNFVFNFMQINENIECGLLDYLQLILNINLDENYSLKLLDYLINLIDKIKNGLTPENLYHSKFLILILFLKLIDNQVHLKILYENNKIKLIYENLIILSKEDILEAYFSNILNIFPIILLKHNYDLNLIDIKYINFEENIIKKEISFCDIFSNYYFILFLIMVIYKKIENTDYDYIRFLLNKILLRINLLKLDFDYNNIIKNIYIKNYFKILTKTIEDFAVNEECEYFYNNIWMEAQKLNINDDFNYYQDSESNSNSSEEIYNDSCLNYDQIKLFINKCLTKNYNLLEQILDVYKNCLINCSNLYKKNMFDWIYNGNENYFKEIEKIKLIKENGKTYFRKIVHLKKNN